MVEEKPFTVEGLQKDRAKLKASFERLQKKSARTRVAYEAAKIKYVNFNNTYGRVLEVLESAKKE